MKEREFWAKVSAGLLSTKAGIATEAVWIGRVSNDSRGELVLRALRAEGVTAVGTRDAHVRTGLMIKERRSVRETKFWYYRGGNAGSPLSPGRPRR